MTHPDTPLLLLSPLPSIEDSALFLPGDQQVSTRGESSGLDSEEKSKENGVNQNRAQEPLLGVKRQRDESDKAEAEAQREVKKTKKPPKDSNDDSASKVLSCYSEMSQTTLSGSC